MRSLAICLCVLTALACGPDALAQAPLQSPGPGLREIAARAGSIELTRIVTRVGRSKHWATVRSGPLCLGSDAPKWGESADAMAIAHFEEVFRNEFEGAGFPQGEERLNLFEDDRAFSEFAIGAVVRNAEADLCLPTLGILGPLGGAKRVKGEASLDVEWQIYSRIRREVVARIPIRSRFESREAVRGDVETAVLEAFAANVRQLIASDDFRQAFAEKAGGEPARPGGLSPVRLETSASGEVAIADAIGAVVLVFAGNGHGSGVLVSRDGYVLTDQHVVGSATYVKIRWADGIEGLGEVVRADRRRDVALIRTDPRGRQPLNLRTDFIGPGETVYAVGAPLEDRFQSTVTKGIVSAYRTIEGLRYLQSDVAVSPGNSGGPLLDEEGSVVALTVSTYRVGGAPTGINFFTPIRDALDFLGVEAGEPAEDHHLARGEPPGARAAVAAPTP